jgi:hypothetical protein
MANTYWPKLLDFKMEQGKFSNREHAHMQLQNNSYIATSLQGSMV